MEEIEATASLVPWMVNCGNHDCLYLENPNIINWEGAVLTSGVDGGQVGRRSTCTRLTVFDAVLFLRGRDRFDGAHRFVSFELQ